jgi:hypothetical protein
MLLHTTCITVCSRVIESTMAAWEVHGGDSAAPSLSSISNGTPDLDLEVLPAEVSGEVGTFGAADWLVERMGQGVRLQWPGER